VRLPGEKYGTADRAATAEFSSVAKIAMQANDPDKRRWPIATLLRLAVSLSFIGCIIWWLGGVGKIGAIVSRISFGLAALVIILIILDRALMTYKWTLLLKAKGIHLHLLTAMKIYCASMIWGTFLPPTVGADTIRAVSTARTGISTNEVVASIVVERMIGFLSALLLGLVSLVLLSTSGLLESRFMGLWWAALGMILLAAVVLVASFSDNLFHLIHNRILGRSHNNRIAEKLRKFHETYRAYRNNTGTLIVFFVLTFAEQLEAIVQSWLMAWALGIHVGILYFTMAIPLSVLVSRIPIGIGGLGTYEAASAFLLSLAGVSGAEGVAIAFSGRILQILSWLPWWFAHVISTGSARPATQRSYPKDATAA
jgi:uncharacterized protein (TIRG00374 family)